MNDTQIIELYFSRSESAIEETARKYGGFLRQVAYNILQCREDSEEVAEDTYLRAWNSIPPTRPEILKHFLSRIARNLALDRWKYHQAQRRGGEMALLLSELEDCIGDDGASVDKALEVKELGRVLKRFLHSLDSEDKAIFLARYYYGTGMAELARHCSLPERKLKYRLSCLRRGLRAELEKEGIYE